MDLFSYQKKVSQQQSEKYKQKYIELKIVESIMKLLSIRTKKPLIYLYENIVWPLNKIYYHSYDTLKSLANGNMEILDKLKISNELKNEFLKIVKIRLAKPLRIIYYFKITCYSFNGIDDIKESLINGEKKGNEITPIKIEYVSSPLYKCICKTTDEKKGLEKLNEALSEIKKSIEEKGGKFLLEKTPIIKGKKKIF